MGALFARLCLMLLFIVVCWRFGFTLILLFISYLVVRFEVLVVCEWCCVVVCFWVGGCVVLGGLIGCLVSVSF